MGLQLPFQGPELKMPQGKETVNSISHLAQAVRELKLLLSSESVPKISQFQYDNTPSCENIDFGETFTNQIRLANCI